MSDARPSKAENERKLLHWGQQMLALRALQTLAPHFERADIPVFPVKGIALGHWLYSDLRERGLRDVDLLVRPEQVPNLRRLARSAGWLIHEDRTSVGDLAFSVDGVVVEAHASVGLPDLTGLPVEALLQRATYDTHTFACAVRRIDDLDHFCLLAANILKDHFRHSNAHQSQDLRLLWVRLAHRLEELTTRIAEAGFSTGMHAVATYLLHLGQMEFRPLEVALRPRVRHLQGAALAAVRKFELPGPLAAAAIAYTNDHFLRRLRCLARLPGRAADSRH